MWLIHTYVAVLVACTNPGAADEFCRGEALAGFTDRESCEASVVRLVSILKWTKREDLHVRIEGKCIAGVPPKEA